MASSTTEQHQIPDIIQNNSNLQYLSELGNISADATAKDLTEKQKLAFMAMMRIVHDPSEKQWVKRIEKMDRQRAAKSKQQEEVKQIIKNMGRQRTDRIGTEFRQTEKEKVVKRESLKKKIKRMRTERKFPLPPEKRDEDPARRYGFIPRSQKKTNLADYAKI